MAELRVGRACLGSPRRFVSLGVACRGQTRDTDRLRQGTTAHGGTAAINYRTLPGHFPALITERGGLLSEERGSVTAAQCGRMPV